MTVAHGDGLTGQNELHGAAKAATGVGVQFAHGAARFEATGVNRCWACVRIESSPAS